MSRLYIEAMFCGTPEHEVLYHTNVGLMCDSDDETRCLFENARKMALTLYDDPSGEFLFDLRDDDTIHDTIFVTRYSYERITGEAALTADEYAEIDRKYWEKAKVEYEEWKRNGRVG